MTRSQDEFPEDLRARFRPLRRLGAGAMGTVHLCEDSELSRRVAVKLIQGSADGERRRRFHREAEAMAGIDHPNALKVYDHGTLEDGTPYLVVEYLEGRSLEDLVHVDDPLGILLPIADALERCHRAGVIHRDVKPANLFLTKEGRPVLLDFGLAKPLDRTAMTQTGHVVGTPVYLAPEALRGEEPAPAWDWYALGVTLFALVEERLPYQTRDLVEWMGDPELRPAFGFQRVPSDGPVARAVRALMADDPTARPHSREALEAATRAPLVQPSPAPRPAPLPAAEVPPTPGRASVPGVAVVAWLVLMVAVGWWWAPEPQGDVATEVAPPAPREPKILEPIGVNEQGHREFRNERTGGVMILVPGGAFRSRPSVDVEAPGEVREVALEPFLIGKTEVTVAEYWRYGNLPGNRPRKGLHLGKNRKYARRPMIALTWHEVREFCAWAGGRLPTALEWERAAGGTEGWTYPWGEEEPTEEQAAFGLGNFEWALAPERYLVDVGSYPAGASPVGALDMAGNIYEWTSDIYEPTRDRPEPDRVMKGGNRYSGGKFMRSWHRRGWAPDVVEAIGFRLVMDVPPGLLAEGDAP
jgi:serine/threonine-protein kinase